MAKSQTARSSTIKNDPFASLIPDRISEQATEGGPSGSVTPIRPETEPRPAENHKVESHKKEKLTVHLTHDLIERVKNAAYWNPRLTIASIAELGVKYAIEQVEEEHGGPYPPREAELKGGRPIGS
jgi:hypothetical protein